MVAKQANQTPFTMSFCRQLFVAVLVVTQASISTALEVPYSKLISDSGAYSHWPLDASTVTQNPPKAIDVAGFRDGDLVSGDGGFAIADGATADNSQSVSLNLPANGGSGAHISVPYSQYLNLNPSNSENSLSIEGWVRLAANADLQQNQPFLSSFSSTNGNEG